MENFDYLKIQMKDIVSATNNFDPKRVIGSGGFGRVYKGELYSLKAQTTLAFKKLDRRYGQGNIEFWKEIMMLSSYKHENLISLKHFCIEGDDMILVYEYASRGSLDRYLSDASTLTWIQRLNICVGAAHGLCFLHDPKDTHLRVLHRDIKSANILLDDNWTAKVSDFGLSKLGPANQVHSYLFSHGVGTPGYCDPLYMELGFLSKESDVYSFGVVLFEILCGRLCYECCNGEQTKILVPRWRKCYNEKMLDEIILPELKDQMDPGSLESFSAIAYRCVNKAREERPTMGEIVEELEFSLELQENFEKRVDYSQPSPISDGNAYSFDLEDDGPVIDDFQIQGDATPGGSRGFAMREASQAFTQVTTVVLKLRMHCESCAQKIRKRILRMKGVESVEPDLKASRVSVKGTFEASQLVDYVYKQFGKKSVIVKQDPELKKEEDKGKEEKKANADSGAKKDKEKEEEKDGGEKREEKKANADSGVKKDKEIEEKKDSNEKKEEKRANTNSDAKKETEKEERKDGGKNKEEIKAKAASSAKKDKEKEEKNNRGGDNEEGAKADGPTAGGGKGGDDTKVGVLRKSKPYYYHPQGYKYYYHPQGYKLELSQHTMYGLYTPALQIFSDENPHSCTVM